MAQGRGETLLAFIKEGLAALKHDHPLGTVTVKQTITSPDSPDSITLEYFRRGPATAPWESIQMWCSTGDEHPHIQVWYVLDGKEEHVVSFNLSNGLVALGDKLIRLVGSFEREGRKALEAIPNWPERRS